MNSLHTCTCRDKFDKNWHFADNLNNIFPPHHAAFFEYCNKIRAYGQINSSNTKFQILAQCFLINRHARHVAPFESTKPSGARINNMKVQVKKKFFLALSISTTTQAQQPTKTLSSYQALIVQTLNCKYYVNLLRDYQDEYLIAKINVIIILRSVKKFA